MDRDYKLAKQLQKEFENDFKKKHSPDSKHKTTSLVDLQWEIVDPNPDIYSLFQTFNGKYFWNKLGSVEVKWSPRMYSCAGICTYKGRGGCIVSLSLPLLKLRPRKDLVETLLVHSNSFRKHSDLHEYGTRNRDNYRCMSVRLSKTQHSFYYQCVPLFNQLPPHIQCLNLKAFKLKIKYLLTTNCFYSTNEYFDADFK